MAAEQEQVVIDYTKMSGQEMLDVLGDDASKWADAFCQYRDTFKWSMAEIDHGLMISWFANAIENSTDVRNRRGRPATVPVITKPLS